MFSAHFNHCQDNHKYYFDLKQSGFVCLFAFVVLIFLCLFLEEIKKKKSAPNIAGWGYKVKYPNFQESKFHYFRNVALFA